MKADRSFRKRGTLDCPIAIAYYAKGRFLPTSPHWHPEIEIAYVRQGHIVCTVDDQPLHLAAGDILILSPEQDHLYHSPTEDAQVLFLIFSLDALTLAQHHVFQKAFVQPLAEGMLQLPQKLDSSHSAYAQIVEQFDKPYSLYISGQHYKINRYCAVVNVCLALLPFCKIKEDTFPVKVNSNSSVRAAANYIHNWYYRPLTLKKIADKVHLNPTYLSTLFREQTGQTVFQYLTRIRIDAAVYLLQNSELNIAQIAEKVGFRSESTFYQQFRKLTGASPKTFRQAVPADNAHRDRCNRHTS